MPTYIAHINVNEEAFQNPHELVSIWGTIREDIDDLGGDILQTYAVLGGYDFHLTFEAESGEVAFQVSQAIERYGFDTETMRTLPVERIGELVDDI
jgi:uncharacterized protein with GYD domain